MTTSNKTRWDLLPIMPIEEAAKVMTFGANKYDNRDTWRDLSTDDHFSALMRHLAEWKKASDCNKPKHKRDMESGLHHMAHVIARASFIVELDRTTDNDTVKIKFPDMDIKFSEGRGHD